MTFAVYDVLTMDRGSVDLYPEQSGVPLAEVCTFAKSLGGSPTNVAVAAARCSPGQRTGGASAAVPDPGRRRQGHRPAHRHFR